MTPLKAILSALRKPVDYLHTLAGEPAANLDVVADLERFVAGRVEEAMACGPPQAAADALTRLRGLCAGFGDLPIEDKQARLAEAVALLDRAEEAVGHAVSGNAAPQSRGTARRAPGTTPEGTSADGDVLDTPAQYVKGVGPRRAALLERLGVRTLGDLLWFLPRRYEDRGRLKPVNRLQYGKFETIVGNVIAKGVVVTPRKRMRNFELVLGDGTGWLSANWFNQPYLDKVFETGQRVILGGVLKPGYRSRFHMDQPEFEIVDPGDEEASLHTGRIVPIYRETQGLTSRQIRSILDGVLETFLSQIPETLPSAISRRHRLLGLHEALREAHFPSQGADISALDAGTSPAHRRLAFEELLLLEVGLAQRKRVVVEEPGIAFSMDGRLTGALLASLDFDLTKAQRRVLEEVRRDMAAPSPMNRLIQGDVGCGKTIVALLAMLMAVEGGHQAAIMAPTEILAEQHARNLTRLLAPLNLSLAFLRSGMRKRDRQRALDGIGSGEVPLVVGTHALIQEDVRFHCLGLAVVDEQHRFGVLQRATFTRKGLHPDVLVMTATPIPRTLALTLYGDLDVSVIDALPPGRRPVKTALVPESRRRRMYEFVLQEVGSGRQAYVVYPLVEESEKMDLKAATVMARHLQEEIFPDLRVGLVHGKLKPAEKDAIMEDFASGKIHVLVATSVIEVGVDVPNATVMILEHAERFGLSQMHQLRGRVGRGPGQSHCFLVASYPLSEEARRRLKVMVQTHDGFKVAEEDLAIRGPGEFFGTRQSGLPDFRVANLIRDSRLLEIARQEAFQLVEHSPCLEGPDLAPLRAAFERRWANSLHLIQVG